MNQVHLNKGSKKIYNKVPYQHQFNKRAVKSCKIKQLATVANRLLLQFCILNSLHARYYLSPTLAITLAIVCCKFWVETGNP